MGPDPRNVLVNLIRIVFTCDGLEPVSDEHIVPGQRVNWPATIAKLCEELVARGGESPVVK